MALSDDLDRIGAAAQQLAGASERVTGVLAAEVGARRIYLCAYDSGAWLALDDDGKPATDARTVRDAAQLAAMCEVAADAAGGEELDELRLRLRELREHEHPPGIEDAEAAAAELAAALDEHPRVATTALLDRIGALARRLEHTLGTDAASPFGAAVQHAMPAVDELAADVERNHKLPLR